MGRTAEPPPGEYELLDNDQGHSKPDSIKQVHKQRGLLQFIQENRSITLAFLTGTAGAVACFAFTYWLSTKLFVCPPWSIFCHVGPSVHLFATNLGLLQGFISTLYGISIVMMAYATYQFAEIALWPAMTEEKFTLREIDRFLAHVRGSLASPRAIWHARTLVSGYVGINELPNMSTEAVYRGLRRVLDESSAGGEFDDCWLGFYIKACCIYGLQ